MTHAGSGSPLRRALRLRPADHAASVRVLALAVATELALAMRPVEDVARRFGVRIDLSPPAPPPIPPEARRRAYELRLSRDGRATDRVLRYWPTARGPCLRRAIVLARLLRAEGAVVRIGIDPTRPADDLRAHAWVEVDGAPLEPVDGLVAFTGPLPPA